MLESSAMYGPETTPSAVRPEHADRFAGDRDRFQRDRGSSFRARLATVAIAVLASGAVAGCTDVGSPDPEADRQAIDALLRAYLPKLAEAYKTRNPYALDGLAVAKEIAHVEKMTEDLAAKGQIFEPELKDLEIETFSVWKYANAFVTTVEVWDIRSYSIGSHVLLSEARDQRNRVRYQLKRKDAGWMILYRDRIETLE